MKIGEAAAVTGFSQDTLRWYEKIGLINPKQDEKNSYRNYDQFVIDQLITIRQAKQLGFKIKEIKHLLSLDETSTLNCSSLEPMIDLKIQLLSEQIKQLQTMRRHLQTTKSDCTGNCKEMLHQRAK